MPRLAVSARAELVWETDADSEDLFSDYAAEFSAQSATLAIGHGVTAGHAAAPQEINNHHFDRKGSYSHTFGYASGLDATLDQTESYYIATVGYDNNEGFSFGSLSDVPAAFVSIFERVMGTSE